MNTEIDDKTSPQIEPGNRHNAGNSTIFRVIQWIIPRDVDKILKLGAAFSVVFAAFIAKSYESKMSAVTLITEREQAESELRANMFSHLIDPVAGSYGDAKQIKLDRELLLVELLALNFHEHFEFKPLLLHVDQRLASTSIKDMTPEQLKKGRDSLRSIARRVIDRQIALLIKEEAEEPLTLEARPDKLESFDEYKYVAVSDFENDDLVNQLFKNRVIKFKKKMTM